MGLFICKGIIEAHGGRIWAESDGLHKGSRFTFTLPVVGFGVDESRPPAYNHPEDIASKHRDHILVVDDDPQTLRYVRDTLTREGYVTTVAADPIEASRLMREIRPHLALLDLMLPGKDGIALMKEIHSLADIPEIFLSAYDMGEVIVRAFDNGASDYMVKPFSPTELVAIIRSAIQRRSSHLPGPSNVFVSGDLTIEYVNRTVFVGGIRVQLTATEYAL